MKRILVALDSSPRAEGVLAFARELATLTGGKLVLLQAVGVPLELPIEAYRLPPMSLAEVLQQDARKNLEALAKPLGSLVESVEIGTGTAWRFVCDAAKALDADLVVVGSHGYGPLDHLIGTTAARIVNHCDRSVLVVRPRP